VGVLYRCAAAAWVNPLREPSRFTSQYMEAARQGWGLRDGYRRITALRGDVEVLGELFSFYIFHWLGYTPRLDKAERVSLVAEAKERHEKFMRLFAKKLSAGELSLGALFIKSLEEVAQEEDDDGPMDQAANED
jgi:hypothetical protein